MEWDNTSPSRGRNGSTRELCRRSFTTVKFPAVKYREGKPIAINQRVVRRLKRVLRTCKETSLIWRILKPYWNNVMCVLKNVVAVVAFWGSRWGAEG